MNFRTRWLMTASALFMASLGLLASFFPQETLAAAGADVAPLAVAVVEIAGALYLGFAILNWTARGILIGGIYGRPVAMGNFLHFTVAATVLIKRALGAEELPLLLGASLYAAFAAWFGAVLFTHPRAADPRPKERD